MNLALNLARLKGSELNIVLQNTTEAHPVHNTCASRTRVIGYYQGRIEHTGPLSDEIVEINVEVCQCRSIRSSYGSATRFCMRNAQLPLPSLKHPPRGGTRRVCDVISVGVSWRDR